MVAIWRDAELEAVLGGPLDATGLTAATLQQLVESAALESEVLEFKSRPHLDGTKEGSRSDEKDWSPQQEFAKDVCAFANRRGGLLLLGVGEDGEGRATSISPVTADVEAIERQLRQALVNFAAPVPRIEVLAVPAPIDSNAEDSGHVLAVAVPPGPAAPHAVVNRPGAARESLYYPMRDRAGSRPMRENEVADQYRRRMAGAAERVEGVERTVAAGVEAISRVDGTWLYVALTPESRPASRVDREAVREVRTWIDSYGFATPLPRFLHLEGAVTPAPDRAVISESRWVGESDDGDPTYQHCELYLDGRSFIATELETASFGEPEVGVVGTQVVAADVLNAVHLATSWAAERAGAWGTATAVVGIRARRTRLDAPPDIRVRLHESRRDDRAVPLRDSRSPISPFSSEVAVDLGSCRTIQEQMAVGHDVLAALLHHFGVAEPEHVRPDGSINPYAWEPQKHSHEVKQWADLWDLPIADR